MLAPLPAIQALVRVCTNSLRVDALLLKSPQLLMLNIRPSTFTRSLFSILTAPSILILTTTLATPASRLHRQLLVCSSPLIILRTTGGLISHPFSYLSAEFMLLLTTLSFCCPYNYVSSHCSQIPKLRVACAAGLNGQRTMWSFCEQCGAISMVESD